MTEFNTQSQACRDALLDDLEGNVDTELGLTEVQTIIKKKTLTLLDISQLENEYKVKFSIEFDTRSITLYSDTHQLIGYMRPGFYTYGKVSKSSHIERKIFDDFRGKGYGQLLHDVYEGLHFSIPKDEYTHKASVILFLLKNGYKLIASFDDNGEEVELSPNEIIVLESELFDLIQKGDEDLNATYKLVL